MVEFPLRGSMWDGASKKKEKGCTEESYRSHILDVEILKKLKLKVILWRITQKVKDKYIEM